MLHGGGSANNGAPGGEGGAIAVGGSVATGGSAPAPAGAGGTAGVAGEGEGGASAGQGGLGGDGGGSAGSAGSGGGTAAPLDFSIWQLQLPTGSGHSPDIKSPKELLKGVSNAYFYQAKDGGQMFMDPKEGITTNGSRHCRSELREMKPDGSAAAWPSSGTNTLTVTGKVPLIAGGTKGSVTIAQVFVSGLNTLAELQYTGSTMKLFYEEAKGNGETPVDLKTPIAIGSRYKFVLGYSKNELTVSINDEQVYSRKPSSDVSGKDFYFKVGNYDQSSTDGTPTTTPYTEVEVYSIAVVHK